MSYKNKTYVAFDGDNDIRMYRLMQAWKNNDHIDFNFQNAHDLNTARDSSLTDSIKAQLRERLNNSKQMLLLLGEGTKRLRKFLPWEVYYARNLDIPIIVVNLNGKRSYNADLCPTCVTQDKYYTIHIPFGMKIIKYALDDFPDAYAKDKRQKTGNYYYQNSVYQSLGM